MVRSLCLDRRGGEGACEGVTRSPSCSFLPSPPRSSCFVLFLSLDSHGPLMFTEAPVHGHPSAGKSQFRRHPRSETPLARAEVPQRGCQPSPLSSACAVCPASASPPPPGARPRVRCLRLPLPDVVSSPILLPRRVHRSSPPSLPPPPSPLFFAPPMATALYGWKLNGGRGARPTKARRKGGHSSPRGLLVAVCPLAQ